MVTYTIRVRHCGVDNWVSSRTDLWWKEKCVPARNQTVVYWLTFHVGEGPHGLILRCWGNGKVVADSEARGRPLRSEGEATQRIGHKFVMGSLGLESILLTEGSFMNGLGSNFIDNCSGATDRLSAPLLRCSKYLGQDSWCLRYATALVPDWLFCCCCGIRLVEKLEYLYL